MSYAAILENIIWPTATGDMLVVNSGWFLMEDAQGVYGT